jgi:hypothetical protein
MALSARQHVVFLVCLAQRPKTVEALFPYFPKDWLPDMQQRYEELKASRSDDLQRVARSELRKLAKDQVPHYLADVHDEWLAEIIQHESPAMIAMLLRYLPAERVTRILEFLPETVLKALPAMGETYAVPQALVNHLRRRFETQFVQARALSKGQTLSWEALLLLTAGQTERVLLESGYREIALGLASVPAHVQVTVLSRLLPSDRERVEHYLGSAAEVGEQRRKRAQMHLIAGEVDPKNPRGFVRELGCLIFVKSLLVEDLESLTPLYRKMAKAEVAILKLLISDHVTKNTDMTVRVYRDDLVQALTTVLQAGAG